MRRIGLTGDIHIRTDELPVELSWNHQRLMLLADEINKLDCDELWVLGDLFDRANATMADMISAKQFIEEIGVPVKYINGNHCRINKDVYSLHVLKGVIGIQPLMELEKIEGVTLSCIGHESIHKIKELPPTDLLLSHFRWFHDIFGRGELLKSEEHFIKDNFKETLLSDIHYPYEPENNVRYISSPYSINFGNPKDYGLMILELDDGDFKVSRVKLDLPCKISTTLPLKLVNGYIENTDPKHKYRIIVKLLPTQFGDFKKLKAPQYVELIPKLKEITNKIKDVSKIEVGGNIKEVLLDFIKLPELEDKEYIKDVLKEK